MKTVPAGGRAARAAGAAANAAPIIMDRNVRRSAKDLRKYSQIRKETKRKEYDDHQQTARLSAQYGQYHGSHFVYRQGRRDCNSASRRFIRSEMVHAEPVQCIGRRFVLYRRSRQPKIELP